MDELNMDCQDVEKFYPHCGNERLYKRLDEAIERGEITDGEAREIYRDEREDEEFVDMYLLDEINRRVE